MRNMVDINKHTLLTVTCCFFMTIHQTVVAIDFFQRNGTNSSKQFDHIESYLIHQILNENLPTLDYYFFSYDIVDHRKLLIKFDLTHTALFQQAHILYDAYLFISKLPATNYKVTIGPFDGYYEKELVGTIIDHFTFCLVLIPSQDQNKSRLISYRNKTADTYNESTTTPSFHDQQHIIHYCTKMGPDEDRHRHHIKQGSEGDHILLLLQLLMIGIFLTTFQIAHIIRDRKYRKWNLRRRSRLRHELVRRKKYVGMPSETLAMLRFTNIHYEESQEEIDDPEKDEVKEEEEEDSFIFSHRRLPTRTMKYQRSLSPSPSIVPRDIITDSPTVEHILRYKPWIRTSF